MFKLNEILLIKSKFSRDINIDFDSSDVENKVNIDSQHILNNEILTVEVTVSFFTKINKKKVVNAKISMAGNFTYTNSKQKELSIETFGNINAPAIIYPFIREHLSNLTIKAGVHPILLPPVNFVKLYNEKLENDTKNITGL